jgi:hypothetical protein
MGMGSNDHGFAETCQVFCERVMLGDGNTDLSSLPREWGEAVRKAMEDGSSMPSATGV